MTDSALVPLTGKEYLDSLDDGREVWIYGERVARITEHPAFRNSARMVARLYDALHDPQRKEILTEPTEYDLDGWTAPDLVNPDDVCILDPKRG